MSARRTENKGKGRVRHQPVNWRRSRVNLAGQPAVPGQEPGKREPLGIGEHRLDGDEGSRESCGGHRAPSVTPTLAGVWRLIDTALADLPAVLAELRRTRAELEAVRLDRANLLAAICATLAADAEGEPDPLGYLRDELNSTDGPAGTRRRS
jgi:hypothetical protein